MDDHDKGLSHDLPKLLSRRRALGLFSGAGLAATLAACSTDEPGSSGAGNDGNADSASGGGSTSEEIPEETAGPFPGNGSNGVNVLSESGVVRSDITKSFGGASAVAAGVPLTVKLRVLDLENDAEPYQGAAIYLWHCDREGRYSLYSEGVTEENYLRGVQEADADGWVTFTSIYPGAYAGRWPHIHFEIYESAESATNGTGKLRTTQLALPEDVSQKVYATDGYDQSTRNLEQTSLEGDNVFSDGYRLQLAKVTGDVKKGLVAALNVPV